MKIRKGFVTNSSSSSFILGFKSEESVKEELKAENLKEYFEEILRDVTEATRLDKEDVLGGYTEEIRYYTRWEVENTLNIPYSERFKVRETEEFQKELNKAITNKVSNLEKAMEGLSVFVEISYSDNDGLKYSELEHYVVPKMKCCLATISHH